MCPACLATLSMVAAGAGSTGGLTALVVRKLRGRTKDTEKSERAKVPDQKEKPR